MTQPTRHNFAALAADLLSGEIAGNLHALIAIIERHSTDEAYNARWRERIHYTELGGVIIGMAIAKDHSLFPRLFDAITADKEYSEMQLKQGTISSAPKKTKKDNTADLLAALGDISL